MTARNDKKKKLASSSPKRKYPRSRGYFVCSKCQKVRDKKIIKELAHSISDLSFYDYPKTIANYKKQEEE